MLALLQRFGRIVDRTPRIVRTLILAVVLTGVVLLLELFLQRIIKDRAYRQLVPAQWPGRDSPSTNTVSRWPSRER